MLQIVQRRLMSRSPKLPDFKEYRECLSHRGLSLTAPLEFWEQASAAIKRADGLVLALVYVRFTKSGTDKQMVSHSTDNLKQDDCERSKETNQNTEVKKNAI